MNVKSFENHIVDVILQRGRDYFQRGHVVNLFGMYFLGNTIYPALTGSKTPLQLFKEQEE